MTSVFSAEGKNIPCTVVEVGPCVVTQVKTVAKDGYDAVQLGFGEQKEKHLTAPELGHFKKAGVAPKRYLAEFKGFEGQYSAGDTITAEGQAPGTIAFAPMGENGFGYDPVFFVPDKAKTFAQLTQEEKAEISHRGKALREFSEKLETYLKK